MGNFTPHASFTETGSLQPEHHVLIVEDSASQRATLRSLLQSWGYSVTAVDSATKALEHCRFTPVPLIISDWMMPGMTGLELCRAIRALNHKNYTYFIMLTARADSRDISEGLEAGADDYLAKPINKDELFARVKNGFRTVSLHQKMRHIANHDALTGLANRTAFHDALTTALKAARKQQHSLGLLLLDVDHFKTINDTHGHDIGDRVLEEFATRIKNNIRDKDIPARLGGDEFAVIFPQIATVADMVTIAERLSEALRQPLFIDAIGRINFSASIGAALFPSDAQTAETLIKNADIALYDAKTRGRDRVAFFDPKLAAAVSQRHKMLPEIEQALEAGEIIPFFQPIIDAKSWQITGFEALVRRQHKDGRIDLPNQFYAALEHPVLASQIGNSIIEQTCDTAEQWFRKGLRFGRLSINISTEQLLHEGLCQRLKEGQARCPSSHGTLAIEITENVVMSNDKHAQIAQQLTCITEQGIEIDLDDFGTGYASLTHLNRFPVSRIKIDRSFVSRVMSDAASQAIIRALTMLAHQLGKKTVAEGVETAKQARLLRDIGCDYLQGFLFAPALPADQAAELFSSAGWLIAGKATSV